MAQPDYQKLEEAINAADVSRDIHLFLKKYLDSPQPLTEDEASNYLMGLEYMARLRWENLWEVFCQEFRLDHHAPRHAVKSSDDISIDLGGADLSTDLSGFYDLPIHNKLKEHLE